MAALCARRIAAGWHSLAMAGKLLTLGHGTLPAAAFSALLRAAGVALVVDIRTAPGSRRHPQFDGEEMARWLGEAGVGYRSERALGGWRRARADSANTALRNSSFRGYADYMETSAFWSALEGVMAEVDATEPDLVSVMCSESLWWRCHRRLVADAVVLCLGRPVEHLMHDGTLAAHPLTSGVRVAGERLVRYDDPAR